MEHTRDIVYFRHCSSKKTFCFNHDNFNTCPICHQYMMSYAEQPVVVPYPYRNAGHEPTTVVIRPANGSFLTRYKATDDLHIGIVNSKGIVFEFDRQGIKINDHSKWKECIPYKLVPSSWDDHWDETLKAMLEDNKWNSAYYNEASMNCFNFVIEFINKLKCPDLSYTNKEELCEKLLLKRIQDAQGYNYLYGEISRDRHYFPCR